MKLRIALLALLCMTSAARAQPGPGPTAGGPSPSTPPGPPVATRSTDRNRGIMIRGGMGVDGCYDAVCIVADADPLLYLRTVALFRIHKYFAAGLHIALNFGLPDDEHPIETDIFWNFILGMDFRGFLPVSKKLEVWGGVTLGYGRAMWDYDEDMGPVTESYETWADAFVMGWGLGADYYFKPNMAVGGGVYHYRFFPRKACSNNGDKECDKLSSQERRFFGAWWTLGVAFTYFIPF